MKIFPGLILSILCFGLMGNGLKLPRPNLQWDSFYREGDLKLGGIFPLHRYAPDTWCSENLLGTLQTQFVQAVVFAVERINKERSLLHNLTLGFVIYDDCAREMVALARAMSFVGGHRSADNDRHTQLVTVATEYLQNENVSFSTNYVSNDAINFNETFPNNSSVTTEVISEQHTANKLDNNNDLDLDMNSDLQPDMTTLTTVPIPYHKVIGVVGPMRSVNTILTAEFFTLFKMPQISAVSSADDLSNKAKYPYFLRMVSPDQNQAEAIVSLLKEFQWTYFSAVYSQGSYGRGGMNRVQSLAGEAGMCVAYLKEINPTYRSTDFDDVIRKLRKHSNAKAVVVFANAQEAKSLIEAAKRAATHGEFIWIFSDGLSSLSSLGESTDVVQGSFMVHPFSRVTPEFDDYFMSLNLENNKDNPWFRKFWELYFKCSFVANYKEKICTGDEVISTNNGFKQDGRVSLFIDLIETYALAIRDVIEKDCAAFINGSFDRAKLVECVHRSDLIEFLKVQDFYGQVGTVKFDENGDMLGLYTIDQVVKNEETGEYKTNAVGLWGNDRGLAIPVSPIQWEMFTGSETEETAEPIGVPWLAESFQKIPASVCSQPCGLGELVFIQEVSCCWECHKCRPNEVTNADLKTCSRCDLGYWPNDNQTYCEIIEGTYLSLPSVYAVILVVVTIASMLVEGGVIGTFIYNRCDKLIKATSRELSLIILVGLTLGLLTVFTLVARPNYATCVFCRVAFHMSVTICYAALLVRTNRIYRIFEAGRRTKRRPPLISTAAQIIFTLILIATQVVITSVTTVLYPPKPMLSMPIVDTRYVELSCDLPLKGLVIPLCYNLLLIALSTFFGFKIRRLPENFNESKCIFVCACTTLFVFSAFLPTYFVSLYSHYKSMLLSLCLILNADVILLMLFMPRVYALYWVNDQSIVYGDTKGTVQTTATGSAHRRSDRSNSSQDRQNRNNKQNQKPISSFTLGVSSNNRVAPSIEVMNDQE